MRIIAMLSLYNEEPDLITESISRVKALGIDVLLCCDGPYDLYPDKEWDSPDATYEAALAAWGGAANFGWYTKHEWRSGNEVEKRNFLLNEALVYAKEGDWLLVFDSDHMWEMQPALESFDLHDVFRQSEVHPPYQNLVAEVSFADCAIDESNPSWYEARLLYRAVPGMRYEGAHWRLRFPDGTVSTTLRTEQGKHTASTIDLRDSFRVRHVVYQAGEERRARQTSWYEQRDGLGLEK